LDVGEQVSEPRSCEPQKGRSERQPANIWATAGATSSASLIVGGRPARHRGQKIVGKFTASSATAIDGRPTGRL
jgi:hypothetical protein